MISPTISTTIIEYCCSYIVVVDYQISLGTHLMACVLIKINLHVANTQKLCSMQLVIVTPLEEEVGGEGKGRGRGREKLKLFQCNFSIHVHVQVCAPFKVVSSLV